MSMGARVLRWAGAACILAGISAWVLQPWLLPAVLPWAAQHLSDDHVVTAHGRLLLRLGLAGLGACAVAFGAFLWLQGRRGGLSVLVQLFADEPRRPDDTSYRAFAASCGLTLICLAGFLAWRGRPWFTGEDQALEYAQFFAGAAAAVLFAAAALRLPRRCWPRRIQAALAIGCGGLALEEISWGQRLFGWETPAFWARLNQQQETNLHNYLAHSFAAQLVGIGVLFLACLAGMLLRSRRAPEGLHVWLLPPPNLLPVLATIVIIGAVHPRTTFGTGWDEFQELLGALLLALFGAVSLARSATATLHPRVS